MNLKKWVKFVIFTNFKMASHEFSIYGDLICLTLHMQFHYRSSSEYRNTSDGIVIAVLISCITQHYRVGQKSKPAVPKIMKIG